MQRKGPWASGLLSLLNTLGQNPEPVAVAAELLDGPLRSFDAVAIFVALVRDDHLETIAAQGFEESVVEHFRTISLNNDFPITRSVRENEVIVASADGLFTDYPDLGRDEVYLETLHSRVAFGSIVSAPIVLRGLAIGAYTFTCNADRAWHTLEIAILDAISSALGLWMTHPATPGLGHSLRGTDAASAGMLTDRQRRILSLVHHGRSTQAIARDLGVSESTVKQDLARAIRQIGARSRVEAAHMALAKGLLP